MRPPEQYASLNITKRCNQHCISCFEGNRSGWDEAMLEEVFSRLELVARKQKSGILTGAPGALPGVTAATSLETEPG
jgi:MoaA/NifB/PqqE/SkfB family radical SAM enzyme